VKSFKSDLKSFKSDPWQSVMSGSCLRESIIAKSCPLVSVIVLQSIEKVGLLLCLVCGMV
jgi:hypothetical protein